MKIRAQIDLETVKGLLLINGGGGVALLTIISAAIEKDAYKSLVYTAFIGILIFGFGLVFAIVHNMLRRKCSLIHDKHEYRPPSGHLFGKRGFQLRQPTVCWWSMTFAYLSVAAFVSAGLYVCITAINASY